MICSKNELNNTINFTTNENKILEFLEKDSPKIILITYQSLELLINVITENEFKIDILCFDWMLHILEKTYLNESNRVLEYNGKIIISESREIYEIINY